MLRSLATLLVSTLTFAVAAPAQSAAGIAVPALLLRDSTGAWSGHYCPQPGAWSMPAAVTVPSGSNVTIRSEFFSGNWNGPFLIAYAPLPSGPFSVPNCVGPLLLDPGQVQPLVVGLGTQLSQNLNSCYGSFGIEVSGRLTLPANTDFSVQALTPDVFAGRMIFSPRLTVHVR